MTPMRKETQSRTLSVILSLIVFVVVNTSMQLLNTYSEWFAWTLYALMVAAVFVVLRYQQRLTAQVSAALLALPFVLAALGALLQI
jgi:positive regulator of sigma E activity